MLDVASTARTVSDARLMAMARAYHRFGAERPRDADWTPEDEAEELAMWTAIVRLPRADGLRIDAMLEELEVRCTRH